MYMQLSRWSIPDSSTDHQEELEGEEAKQKASVAMESVGCACLISEWSWSTSMIALARSTGPSRKVAQREAESCS